MQYHEIGKTGMKVSSLSFGASSLGGVFHDIKEKRRHHSRIHSNRIRHQLHRCIPLTTDTTKPRLFLEKP